MGPPERDPSPPLALLGVLLAVVTVAVYAPVLGHGFLSYDDPVHVTENPHVAGGLSAENLRWAFTSTPTGYWVPLSWVSHQADATAFGLAPGGHHAVNLALHVVNTLLLLVLLARATGRPGPSAFVAACFALHPVHVESVAWISERKDLLSTALAFSAMLAYARGGAGGPSRRALLLALGLFALALLAKPMVVTLPLLLLCLDVWPLGRLTARRDLPRALLSKVPFLALAVPIAWITVRATRDIGALSSGTAAPLLLRLENAASSWLAYLGDVFWPVGLSVFYPYPPGPADPLRLLLLAAVLVGLTVLLLRARRRRPALAAGWVWYLVALLPVIGLLQAGAQARADRYTYVALVGVFWILAFGGADLGARLGVSRQARRGIALAVLALLAVATQRQVRLWKDGETLYAHGISVTDGNDFLRMKLGTLLTEQGRPAEAVPLFEEALRIRPGSADLRVNYANALAAAGRRDEALAQYEEAVRREPESAFAHYNLAVALTSQEDPRRAVEHYEAAVRLDPRHEPALANLGALLLDRGDTAGAIARLEQALALAPEDVVALRPYAFALSKAGRIEEAIAHYERLLALAPEDAWAHTNLGILWQGRGERERAISAFRRALAIDPSRAEARARLEALEDAPDPAGPR